MKVVIDSHSSSIHEGGKKSVFVLCVDGIEIPRGNSSLLKSTS